MAKGNKLRGEGTKQRHLLRQVGGDLKTLNVLVNQNFSIRPKE